MEEGGREEGGREEGGTSKKKMKTTSVSPGIFKGIMLVINF